MLDGLIGLQQTQFAQLASGAGPDTLLTGHSPVYRFYPCEDGGFVSVGAIEPQFQARVAVLTGGDLSDTALSQLFRSAPRDAWLDRLGDACVVPVLRPDEVALHPQVAARACFDEHGFAHPPTGAVSGSVPRLGEHLGF